MYEFPSGWMPSGLEIELFDHEKYHTHKCVIHCLYNTFMPFAVFCEDCGYMVADATLDLAIARWNKI